MSSVLFVKIDEQRYAFVIALQQNMRPLIFRNDVVKGAVIMLLGKSELSSLALLQLQSSCWRFHQYGIIGIVLVGLNPHGGGPTEPDCIHRRFDITLSSIKANAMLVFAVGYIDIDAFSVEPLPESSLKLSSNKYRMTK